MAKVIAPLVGVINSTGKLEGIGVDGPGSGSVRNLASDIVSLPAMQAGFNSGTAEEKTAFQASVSGGAGGGSALWTSVAYSTTIPLDGTKYMPQQTLSGPVSFSVGPNPAAGALCYVRLVADAANNPQFAGMVADPASDGWATIAGTVHAVSFRYDGTTAYYSIQQLVESPLIVPIAGTAAVDTSVPTTIVLGYSTTLSTAAPAASAYSVTSSVSATTVTAVAISGSTVTLTLSRAATVGETLTLSYAPPGTNPIRTPSGGLALGFTNKAVTNSLSAGDYMSFATLTSFTVQTGADNGYDIYTVSGGAWASKTATPSKMLTLNPAADQYFDVTVSGQLVGLGLHTNLSTATNTTSAYFCFGNNTTGFWKQQTGGMTVLNASIPCAANDRARYRLTPANVLYFEVSKDNGATWTAMASKTITDAVLYPRIGASDVGSTVRSVRCNGVTAA